jgi:alkylhydroperoxidase family enzyme
MTDSLAEPAGPGRPTRIGPLDEAARSVRQQEVVDDLVRGPTVNIYTTLARAPRLLDTMTRLGRSLRREGLPPRHREILILRAGWRCQSEYEFAQHRRLAREAGMTDDDIQRTMEGSGADGWDPFEALLCRAVDELHEKSRISDVTWTQMAEVYDDEQMIQATMLVGYYHLVAFCLNSLGVPLEPGAIGFAQGT